MISEIKINDEEDDEEEEEKNNHFHINDYNDNRKNLPISIQSSENQDRAFDDEIEEVEEEYRVKISQEKCVYIINKTFDAMMTIGLFLILTYWIAQAYDYNYFPFTIEDINSWAYQVAQVVFLVSYWTTNIVVLRTLVIIGYIFYFIWVFDASKYPSMDFLLFGYIYIIINSKKIIELLYSKRPIIFDNMRECVYINIFEGIMTRSEYQILANTSLIRELPKGALYCKVGDKCNSLSILIDGRIRIYKSHENMKTTFINNHEFIDSAEWLLKLSKRGGKGRRFNYHMKADDRCIYLTWPREILYETLKQHPEMVQKLNGALGIDVSTKLFNNASLY